MSHIWTWQEVAALAVGALAIVGVAWAIAWSSRGYDKTG